MCLILHAKRVVNTWIGERLTIVFEDLLLEGPCQFTFCHVMARLYIAMIEDLYQKENIVGLGNVVS